MDLSDGKISNDTCYEIIEQYEKRYEGETASEKKKLKTRQDQHAFISPESVRGSVSQGAGVPEELN